MSEKVLPVKDLESERPVATEWRSIIREIANSIARDNFSFGTLGVVDEVAADDVEYMRENILDYGEQLADLSEETWESSVAQWLGHGWDMLVDLWTVESGRSDLVLALFAYEVPNGIRFRVKSIYVP